MPSITDNIAKLDAPVFAVPEDFRQDPELVAATKQKLLDAGVKYCYASYVDLHGVSKAKTTPIESFEKMTNGSELFTVGAMEGMGLVGPEEDECAAVPDLDTCVVFPWDRTQAWFTGQLYYHGEPYPNDSRVILKRQLEKLASMGMGFNLGCEPEFYVLKLDDNGKPEPIQPVPYTGLCPAYDIRLTSEAMAFLDPMVKYMNELGFGVYSFDQEGGHSQFEFDFRHSDVLTMCDRLVFLRMMAKHVAASIGAVASFMPKPFPGDFRSGAHFNMSLYSLETGENLFAPAESFNGDAPLREKYGVAVSEMAYHFTAGILRHADAITALSCPTYNSYQGLIAQGEMLDVSWAPVVSAWGKNNRSTMMRIPMNRYCVENRAVDMSVNPYLAAALTLAAGLEGVDRELDPGEPLNVSSYATSKTKMREAGVKLLPKTLQHAVDALEADDLAGEVLGEMRDIFVDWKTREFDDAFYRVSPWQLEKHLTLV